MSEFCLICQEDINLCIEEISVLNCGHLYHKILSSAMVKYQTNLPRMQICSYSKEFCEKGLPF